jgi:hypothetical protein
MTKSKHLFAGLALLGLVAVPATAAEIVWKGGAQATATSGCTGWDPKGDVWLAYYFFPLSGTSNGSSSTFSFQSGNSAEAFQLGGGKFSSTFKSVTATHIYTRAGQYPSKLKIISQTPALASVTTATQTISGSLQIKGWDNWDESYSCVVTINYSLQKTTD